MADSETPAAAPAPPRLSDFIRAHREAILQQWLGAVRQLPRASGLPGAVLRDNIPTMLERMVTILEESGPVGQLTLRELPEEHALERLDVGFDLREVASEYSLLRGCVLGLYREHLQGAPVPDPRALLLQVERFNLAVDEAVSIAVTRYTRARQRVLGALDRLAEAAQQCADVDTLLHRLLRVLLEASGAVDSVTVLLREGDTLRVRASVGLEPWEAAASPPLEVGAGFEGRIAAERRSLTLRSAATDPRVLSPALRASGTRALHGLPLLRGEDVLGVVHMGSRTAFEFPREDRLLFDALAGRIGALLAQALLAERERAAREALEERERLLNLVVEQSGDGIAMADAQGVIRLFNAEAERQHGVSARQVSAPKWHSAFGLLSLRGEPLPLEQTPLYRALRGERVRGARWKVRRPDGQVRTLEGSASPLRRPDGALAGAVLTCRDETQRLEREAEQARTLALLDALVSAAPAGVALLDTRLRYVRVNEALAAANGLPAQAHLGLTPAEVLGPWGARFEPLLQQVLRTGQPLSGVEFSAPSAALRPDVVRHWVADYFPVRTPEGHTLGVAGIIQDVTERRRAEEELRRAGEFRERFLGIVSHDLRNPLHAILLSADTLLRAGDLPERHLKAVRRLASSAGRMGRMIEELLDFTRGRLGGGLPVDRRPCDLAQLCRQVLDELRLARPQRTLRLVAQGDLRGEWDPDRVAQLVGNLAKNALDYSPEDSPVELLLEDEGPGVRLTVHNHGSPISPELLPHLFEPFRRGSGQEGGGLGLGLFIAREVVRAHGGSLEVRSTAGDGTRFCVRLPRQPPA